MAAKVLRTAGGTRRIGLVQMRCEPDFDRNLSRAQDAIADAARAGAEVVCLPELFRTPYLCQSEEPSRFDWAESIPGPSTEVLSKQAADLGISLIVSKFYFTPGDLGFRAHQTEAGRLGVLICWDQWFPEAARATALAGADFLFYPTAIGWQFDEGDAVDQAQVEAWKTVQRAHAITNGVFVIVVNRVGHETLEGAEGRGIRFWGGSFVVDPFGRVLAEARHDEEAVLVVDCDPNAIERVRRDWPFLRDRRVDAYGGLSERFLDESTSDEQTDSTSD